MIPFLPKSNKVLACLTFAGFHTGPVLRSISLFRLANSVSYDEPVARDVYKNDDRLRSWTDAANAGNSDENLNAAGD
jgi:hypothetical protein